MMIVQRHAAKRHEVLSTMLDRYVPIGRSDVDRQLLRSRIASCVPQKFDSTKPPRYRKHILLLRMPTVGSLPVTNFTSIRVFLSAFDSYVVAGFLA
jgi:hypothetical protein